MRFFMSCLISLILLFLLMPSDSSTLLPTIFNKLISLQHTKSTTFRQFPPRFATQKGLFSSSIHFNVQSEFVRRDFAIPDSNMFVTNFVLFCLLESQRLYGSSERPFPLSSDSVTSAVEAILSYLDPVNSGVPIYRFWPSYKYVDSNGTVFWQSYPENVVEMAKDFPEFDKLVGWLCQFLHFEKCEKELKLLEELIENGLSSFRITPDLDDTSVNLVLGSLLNDPTLIASGLVSPSVVKAWNAKNEAIDPLLDSMVRYSYAPALSSPIPDTSLLDPRTYLVLHDYIENRKGSDDDDSDPSFRLPTTWMNNVSTTRRTFPWEAMPFAVNNVDASVCSNFLFGLAHLMVADGGNNKASSSSSFIITDEIKNLWLDTWDFVKWGIKSGRVVERPDIALLYYPSLFDFFWFVARFASFIDRVPLQKYPFVEFGQVVKEAVLLVQTDVIAFLNQTRKVINQNTECYWEGFLGNFKGKKPLGEDRIFSTGLVLNSILDAFTMEVQGENSTSLIWRNNTPNEVKSWASQTVKFLTNNLLKRDSILLNAFFSGSGKNLATQPFFFPANYFKFLNGSTPSFHSFPPTPTDFPDLTPDLIDGVLGVIDPEQYAKWLEMDWFGQKPATENTGYDAMFPFWSSNALTYAVNLLGFAKWELLLR